MNSILDQFRFSPLRTVDRGQTRLVGVKFEDTEESAPVLVSLEDAKLWARVDGDDEDDLIEMIIDESIDQAQEITNSSFFPRKVIATFSSVSDEVYLPYGPVIDVISVKDGEDDIEFTFENEALRIESRGACVVTYLAGYEPVPDGVILALRKMIASAYDDREDAVMGGVSEMPNYSRKILMRYRRF